MNSKKRIAIFISGRGSNMLAILKQIKEGILQTCCDAVLVFSNDPEAAGLKSAKDAGIDTAYISSKGRKRAKFDKEIVELLAPLNIDYIVLAGYMRILSPYLINAYKNRIINIHPADTNEFKGLGAYEWAWENKLNETKITIHLVDKGVDTGKILGQATVDLNNSNSLEEIEQKGLTIEHRFYSQVLASVFCEFEIRKTDLGC